VVVINKTFTIICVDKATVWMKNGFVCEIVSQMKWQEIAMFMVKGMIEHDEHGVGGGLIFRMT